MLGIFGGDEELEDLLQEYEDGKKDREAAEEDGAGEEVRSGGERALYASENFTTIMFLTCCAYLL
jgi:hypothetical protein